jgi:hypothetical protein
VLVFADTTHESPPNPVGLSSARPPSSAAPDSRDPCARGLLARQRRHLGPNSPGLHLHRSLLPRRCVASASELTDTALYAVHTGGERRLPEPCRGGRSRGGAGEWRAAPALVVGVATTPQGREEQRSGETTAACLSGISELLGWAIVLLG